MRLSHWCWRRSVLCRRQVIGVACGVAVLAVAVPPDARAQTPSGWGAFLGYAYQRADLVPGGNLGATLSPTSVSHPPGAANGWVVSVERLLPSSPLSWLGEVRGAYAAGWWGVDCFNLVHGPGPTCGNPSRHLSAGIVVRE
jgi:hypothetical protein